MNATRLLVRCMTIVIAALVAASTVSIASAEAAKRLALVVGISDYKGLFDLRNARNDARLMTDTFKSLGFEVVHLEDPSKERFRATVDGFSDRIGADDAVAFYFAGHGYQKDGANMLVFSEPFADGTSFDEGAVSLSDVYGKLRRHPATTLFIFLDACRTEDLESGGPAGNDARQNVASAGSEGARGRGLARLGQRMTFFTGDIDTFVSFSTQPGNTAQDGSGQNSPYTAALGRFIRTAGLDVSEVMAMTRRTVYQETNHSQTPWDHSSLTRRFEFRVCNPDEKIKDGQCVAVPKVVSKPSEPEVTRPKGGARPAATAMTAAQRPTHPRSGSDAAGAAPAKPARHGLPPDLGAGVGIGGAF